MDQLAMAMYIRKGVCSEWREGKKYVQARLAGPMKATRAGVTRRKVRVVMTVVGELTTTWYQRNGRLQRHAGRVWNWR